MAKENWRWCAVLCKRCNEDHETKLDTRFEDVHQRGTGPDGVQCYYY